MASSEAPETVQLSENPRKILVALLECEGHTATTSVLAEWIGETTNNTSYHCRHNLEPRYIEHVGYGESKKAHLNPPSKFRLTDAGEQLAEDLRDGTALDGLEGEVERLHTRVDNLSAQVEELQEFRQKMQPVIKYVKRQEGL